MRLPKIIISDSTQTTAKAPNAKSKRGVIAGDSCNPYLVKSTPYTFDTPGDVGLAFGDQTFYLQADRRGDVDTSNMPNMTAVRKSRDFQPADSFGGERCTPTNYTFSDAQLTPQYVLSPGQSLKTYVTPHDGRQGDLVWKMTPFLFDTTNGVFIANGTDSVRADASGLGSDQFPMQLALRPQNEFVSGDSKGEWATAMSVLAPTNVVTILPLRTLDALLNIDPDPMTTGIASTMATSTSSIVGTSLTSVTSTATPVATAIASASTHGAVSNGLIAGSVLGGVLGLTLLGALANLAYKKVKSLRQDAEMGERMKAWASSRGIELANFETAEATNANA